MSGTDIWRLSCFDDIGRVSFATFFKEEVLLCNADLV